MMMRGLQLLLQCLFVRLFYTTVGKRTLLGLLRQWLRSLLCSNRSKGGLLSEEETRRARVRVDALPLLCMITHKKGIGHGRVPETAEQMDDQNVRPKDSAMVASKASPKNQGRTTLLLTLAVACCLLVSTTLLSNQEEVMMRCFCNKSSTQS